MTNPDRSADGQSHADLNSTAVMYDEAGEIYWTEFDTETRPPSEAVIDAVGRVTGRSPLDLPPLFSVIDPEALDSIFAPTVAGTPRQSEASVTFTYASQQVTVDQKGIVKVSSPSAD